MSNAHPQDQDPPLPERMKREGVLEIPIHIGFGWRGGSPAVKATLCFAIAGPDILCFELWEGSKCTSLVVHRDHRATIRDWLDKIGDGPKR